MANKHKGEAVITRDIQNHLLQYITGIHNAKPFCIRLVHVKNLADVKSACETIFDHNRAYLVR